MMDTHKQPGIKVKTVQQVKCTFERKLGQKGSLNNNFSFRYGYRLLENGCGLAELTLSARGEYKDKDPVAQAYLAEITFIGVFEAMAGSENMNLEEFLANNAAALLLPYIRESLSALSIKSGLPAVYLPPINIIALMENSGRS